ncbi:hypothetical protein AB0P17_04435 [Streptomyces sp. NPDC088124]|uniref:hypothetical protein n=1 Tax=Streptomyces sp. NPDC088124 TaxID=3154654 RepID=UPI00341B7F52
MDNLIHRLKEWIDTRISDALARHPVAPADADAADMTAVHRGLLEAWNGGAKLQAFRN